jgi:hypothetical protein
MSVPMFRQWCRQRSLTHCGRSVMFLLVSGNTVVLCVCKLEPAHQSHESLNKANTPCSVIIAAKLIYSSLTTEPLV